MELQLNESEKTFQKEVREFLKLKFTDTLKQRLLNPETFQAATIEWQKELYNKGWVASGWPKEYGGTGWNITEKFIYSNELAAYGAPEPQPFGIKMVGPVIYTFGNETQKKKYLADILASDIWWCQGYSEPGSGSDLSSLKMKATQQGDNYIVEGAKIWTTYAQYADWIFCLVRTDNSGKPQQGISFLLINMKTPGITVRPIRTIDSAHHLNEVIFDNVEVPRENLIGEEGKGWTYAKFLLDNERGGVAGVSYCKSKLATVKELAMLSNPGETALMHNNFFQQKLSDIEIRVMAIESMELRVLDKIKRGEPSSIDASMLKILGSELQQELQSLIMELVGETSIVVDPSDNSADRAKGYLSRREYLYGRAATIYAGSNEIQRNIISKYKFGF
jgi:alkylation response protein AidB-like acyl-CoA dehydrogenase